MADQPGPEPSAEAPPDAVIVIFGANGDLSKRKLIPALYRLFVNGLLPRNWRLVGSSRSVLTDAEFVDFARDAIAEFGDCDFDADAWETFAGRLAYAPGHFDADHTEEVLRDLKAAAGTLLEDATRLFYLAVPPGAFGPIVQGLGKANLARDSRVVFEKPFGTDVASFEELDAIVHEVLDESQIYRIDHFLGKETLQNVLAIRFANGMFEPVWNRNHIDHVQIDVPETLGIEGRGSFYEATGALRDMVVTHLFQVLSIIALEPPFALQPRPLMDEKLKVFESMAPFTRDDVVFGQFEGYREEPGVAPDSTVETFVAARVMIDNWRWAGVPFLLRTGKALTRKGQLVTLAFREPPREMFRDVPNDGLANDHLTLDMGSDQGMTLSFLAKRPGPRLRLGPARMTFSYGASFGGQQIGAYERLLHDALIGDRTLFTRADGIGRTWELVEAILADPPPLQPYARGSWGPQAADDLIAPRHWHLPDHQPEG